MISIETTYGTTQSSLNCEVVLVLMLEVYRVIQYFEVVPYWGDLVLHLDTVICMVHLWSFGGCAITVYNMCACLFVSYFEVGGVPILWHFHLLSLISLSWMRVLTVCHWCLFSSYMCARAQNREINNFLYLIHLNTLAGPTMISCNIPYFHVW